MARFDDAFKEEVRSRNDIVEVISSYLKLDRRGNRFVGLCPFHSEKTPSFNVVPDSQIYHCFGCKVGGDVFKFIQEREHLTFFEALVFLAKRARIPLPQEERTPEEEQVYRDRRALYDALEFAARFYHSQLMGEPGKAGREYLLGRGLTEETLGQFRLGWAPGYGRLYRSISSRFKPEILQKAGLVLPRREGPGYVDTFFDRVIFPITDLSGRIIGFGGRILQGNGPKYKNTSETPLFSKRKVLFGLAQAKEAIRVKNQAILVEGYMDVITPYQAGIKNVVAPLGTALTDEQAGVIRQQAEQVIVGFDADTAGQIATLKGLEKLYDTGCDVRILRIPDGKDPDEFIRTHGVDSFQRCVDEAVPLVEFKLQLALERNAGNTAETKARAVSAVARVLADLKDDVLREEYVNRLVQKLAESPTEIPELKQAIDRQMNRLLRQGFQHNQPDSRNNSRVLGPMPTQPGSSQAPAAPAEAPMATAEDLLRKAERTLLLLVMQHPNLAGLMDRRLGPSPFEDSGHQTIWAEASGALREGAYSGTVIARVMDRLVDETTRRVLVEMAAKPPISADPEKEAGECIEKIEYHRVSRRKECLENQLKSATTAGLALDNDVLIEYMELQKKLRRAPKS